MSDDPQVVWHEHAVSRTDRETLNPNRGCVVWFTGLSGCGKSTIANIVDHRLYEMGARSFLLDGDNVRHSLCASPQLLAEKHGEDFARRFGLGFSALDREENIRRVGAVARLLCEAGLVTLAAFVSPYRRDRDSVRNDLLPGDFVEVFVDTPLEVCESRDPKGLYKQARAGTIKNFTGIDDPYEPPQSPELHLAAAQKTPPQLADEVLAYLQTHGKLVT